MFNFNKYWTECFPLSLDNLIFIVFWQFVIDIDKDIDTYDNLVFRYRREPAFLYSDVNFAQS